MKLYIYLYLIQKFTLSPHRDILTYKRQIRKCLRKILKTCGIVPVRSWSNKILSSLSSVFFLIWANGDLEDKKKDLRPIKVENLATSALWKRYQQGCEMHSGRKRGEIFRLFIPSGILGRGDKHESVKADRLPGGGNKPNSVWHWEQKSV